MREVLIEGEKKEQMKKSCENCINFDGKYCIAKYEIPYFECVDSSEFEDDLREYFCWSNLKDKHYKEFRFLINEVEI